MIEDDETVESMRSVKARRPKRSFMAPNELRLLRMTMRVTQEGLAKQLLDPDDGLPLKQSTISQWESGTRGYVVPLWAARRIRELAECAQRYDAKREGR